MVVFDTSARKTNFLALLSTKFFDTLFDTLVRESLLFGKSVQKCDENKMKNYAVRSRGTALSIP